ncbi:hypothetical protein LTR66_017446, partial [Elasticomyces elasticus]
QQNTTIIPFSVMASAAMAAGVPQGVSRKSSINDEIEVPEYIRVSSDVSAEQQDFTHIDSSQIDSPNVSSSPSDGYYMTPAMTPGSVHEASSPTPAAPQMLIPQLTQEEFDFNAFEVNNFDVNTFMNFDGY